MPGGEVEESWEDGATAGSPSHAGPEAPMTWWVSFTSCPRAVPPGLSNLRMVSPGSISGSSAREVPPLCQQRLPQGEERCPRGLAGREAWGAPDRHWAHLVVTLSRASQPGCQQWSLGAATGLGQDSTPHGASAAPPPPRPPPNRKVPGFLAGLARAQQPGAVGLLRAGREGAADSEARRGPAGVSGWVFSWPRVEGQEGIIRTWGSRGPTSLTATGRGRRRG